MHHPRVARLDLDGLHPPVFGEVGRNPEVEIRDHAVGRNSMLFFHTENEVRLADLPAFGELGRWRQILVIPFGAPASTQPTIVLISSCERLGLLANSPCFGSANHGGIERSTTRSLTDLAHGLTSL